MDGWMDGWMDRGQTDERTDGVDRHTDMEMENIFFKRSDVFFLENL
jgi:hypothetical protein